MELPFAFESPDRSSNGKLPQSPMTPGVYRNNIDIDNDNDNDNDDEDDYVVEDDSSLVTASSQGSSFLPANTNAAISAAMNHHRTSNSPPILIAPPETVEGNRMASVLSQFGVGLDGGEPATTPQTTTTTPDQDFWYVHVGTPPPPSNQNTDGVLEPDERPRRDILSTVLNPGVSHTHTNTMDHHGNNIDDDNNNNNSTLNHTHLASLLDQAHQAVRLAETAKGGGGNPNHRNKTQRGGGNPWQRALDAHSTAAQLFREAAVLTQAHNEPLTHSFLVLSQTQSKAALALQRAVQLRPHLLTLASQKERLRATVRGAMNAQPREADISDSVFLGQASGGGSDSNNNNDPTTTTSASTPDAGETSDNAAHPVDEMLELERELRDMDMALEMGSSIASLDTRTTHRILNMNRSVVDGSFMMVGGISGEGRTVHRPPSHIKVVNNKHQQQQTHQPPPPQQNKNRVRTILEASRPSSGQLLPQANPAVTRNNPSLESSWWGGGGASQIMSSSVISLATISESIVVPTGPRSATASSGGSDVASAATHTKQLMNLMDSLKVLGDENATLLRQVEQADAARHEAKAAKLQMQQFKEEYGRRFEALRKMLERHRQSAGRAQQNPDDDPVARSEFAKTATAHQQLIRKLTADLKKEKDESRKKDAALKKYESFYLEVKARSAQKQRQREAQQRKTGR